MNAQPKCAIETWWSPGWQRCAAKATHGAYCVSHDWANRFKPFWDEGSLLSGSLIHRTRKRSTPARNEDK